MVDGTDQGEAQLMTGTISFVGAGPGDPELITLKGWRRLQGADAVLYDSLIDERLVEELESELFYVGKRCGRHSMAQDQINALLAELAWGGKHVARLKGGDPAVLGRLGEELLYVAERGIPYEVIPGVSSATAVPMFAGIPVTMRGMADSFVIVTAHRREDARDFSIPPFNPRTTLVLLMALRTTELWREQMLRQGYPADLPVALVSSAVRCPRRFFEKAVITPPAVAAICATPGL